MSYKNRAPSRAVVTSTALFCCLLFLLRSVLTLLLVLLGPPVSWGGASHFIYTPFSCLHFYRNPEIGPLLLNHLSIYIQRYLLLHRDGTFLLPAAKGTGPSQSLVFCLMKGPPFQFKSVEEKSIRSCQGQNGCLWLREFPITNGWRHSGLFALAFFFFSPQCCTETKSESFLAQLSPELEHSQDQSLSRGHLGWQLGFLSPSTCFRFHFIFKVQVQLRSEVTQD